MLCPHEYTRTCIPILSIHIKAGHSGVHCNPSVGSGGGKVGRSWRLPGGLGQLKQQAPGAVKPRLKRKKLQMLTFGLNIHATENTYTRLCVHTHN